MMGEIMKGTSQKDVDSIIGGFEALLSDEGQLESRVSRIDEAIADLKHRLEYASESFEQTGIWQQISELQSERQELTSES